MYKTLRTFWLPGLKNLNLYYQEKKNKDFETLKSINQNNQSSKVSFCPITLGISFLDQIKTLEPLNKLKFQRI